MPTQQANCAANGVPGGAYVQGDGVSGALWRQPGARAGDGAQLRRRPGLHTGVGQGAFRKRRLFPGELIDYIWQASPDEVLFECADRGPARLQDDTPLSGRPGLAVGDSLHANFGEPEVRAFDFAIDWSTMTRIGELNSRLLATYLDRWDSSRFPAARCIHTRAISMRRPAALARVGTPRLALRAWMASYAAEYIGSYSEHVEPWPPFGIEFEPFDRRVDPVLYHDIEAGFKFDSGVTVRAAITNVTDEDPPYLNIAPANTDVATYRLLGRSYFLELRYQVE